MLSSSKVLFYYTVNTPPVINNEIKLNISGLVCYPKDLIF